MIPEPNREQAWLHRMVGDGTMAGACLMGPDQRRAKTRCTDTVCSMVARAVAAPEPVPAKPL